MSSVNYTVVETLIKAGQTKDMADKLNHLLALKELTIEEYFQLQQQLKEQEGV